MAKKTKEKQSTFYYFYSQGRGFCKKSEPIVDEINKLYIISPEYLIKCYTLNLFILINHRQALSKILLD